MIQGNMIGTDASGSRALPNDDGIYVTCSVLESSEDTLIGGTAPGMGNLISGNLHDGINVLDNVSGTTIQQNLIGVDLTGFFDLGNANHGISIDGFGKAKIGSSPAERAPNVIGYNRKDGVNISGPYNNVAILMNSISDNRGLGINLGEEAIFNDPLDADKGPNGLQNTPELLQGTFIDGGLAIKGRLQSKANRAFTIAFFANVQCDPSGFGEGQQFLGTRSVRTDNAGDASFTFLGEALGNVLTATATGEEGTSEFSRCLVLGARSDADGDGVDDLLEDTIPNNGDGNRDGVPDRTQRNVTGVYTPTWGQSVVLEAARSGIFRDVGTTPPATATITIPAKLQLPYDYLHFSLSAPAPAPNPLRASAQQPAVTLYLSQSDAVNTFFLFGPTPENTIPHWFEFTFDGKTGAIVEADRAQLFIEDGGRGDADMTKNGSITVDGALALKGSIPLRIASVTSAPGLTSITVLGEAGQTFELQSSTDLLFWTKVASEFTATGIVHYLQSEAPSDQARFYRIRATR